MMVGSFEDVHSGSLGTLLSTAEQTATRIYSDLWWRQTMGPRFLRCLSPLLLHPSRLPLLALESTQRRAKRQESTATVRANERRAEHVLVQLLLEVGRSLTVLIVLPANLLSLRKPQRTFWSLWRSTKFGYYSLHRLIAGSERKGTLSTWSCWKKKKHASASLKSKQIMIDWQTKFVRLRRSRTKLRKRLFYKNDDVINLQERRDRESKEINEARRAAQHLRVEQIQEEVHFLLSIREILNNRKRNV